MNIALKKQNTVSATFMHIHREMLEQSGLLKLSHQLSNSLASGLLDHNPLPPGAASTLADKMSAGVEAVRSVGLLASHQPAAARLAGQLERAAGMAGSLAAAGNMRRNPSGDGEILSSAGGVLEQVKRRLLSNSLPSLISTGNAWNTS